MRWRAPLVAALSVAVMGLTVPVVRADDGPVRIPRAGQVLGPACPSRVMAFYYDWYGGPPAYRHWANATGQPQYQYDPPRTLAAADYPQLGPYDSHDSAVIDRHLAWAHQAGIDTLISSWWGPHSYEDQSLAGLVSQIDALHQARAVGGDVRASVYLETWALFYGGQLQPSFFTDPANFSPDSRAQIRQKAADWLAYIITTYGRDPAFEHIEKHGKTVPVIFIYTAALFEPVEWQAIFAQVQQATGVDAFYQGDVEGADFQAQAQAFDGLHVYTPVPLTPEGDLSFAARVLNPQGSVTNPASPATDPVTVGADYQAWATEARALGRSWAATVIPGFDDRRVRNPSFVVSRDHGPPGTPLYQRTYDYFWGQALRSRPDWVLITSFNEWHEGTEIEPSLQYQNEFLQRTTAWSTAIHHCEGD